MEYLWTISTLKKMEGIKLSSKIYDRALLFVEDSMRFSTRQKFQNNKFWKDLHPILQQRLVATVLSSQISKLKFFFHDYVENIKAPTNFVTKVMISLDSTIYNVGD